MTSYRVVHGEWVAIYVLLIVFFFHLIYLLSVIFYFFVYLHLEILCIALCVRF